MALSECGRFESFDGSLNICHPFLSNTTSYYLVGPGTMGEWVDSPDRGILFTITSIMAQVLTPECTSNVYSMICSQVFKECREVNDPSSGEKAWIPALLCNSECERHRSIWEECVEDIGRDPAAKQAFDTQMQEVSETIGTLAPLVIGAPHFVRPQSGMWTPFALPPCDQSGGIREDILVENGPTDFLFGRFPQEASEGNLSVDFPAQMHTKAHFPVDYSTYMTTQGVSYEVPCTFLGSVEVEKFTCPFPFVSPIDEDSVRNCVKPCPVPAYTDEEYSAAWSVSSAVALLGLALNIFMFATWKISGQKYFNAVPFQLKFCVVAGILYGAVDTLPTVLLKYQLPCDCNTEECTGESFGCSINRCSIYILLGILINLGGLCFDLYCSLTWQSRVLVHRKLVLKHVGVGLPILLVCLAYLYDTDSTENENGVLNVARHAFKCSMRFENMKTEWLLLWSHFVWAGSLVAMFSLACLHHIHKIQMSTNQKTTTTERRGPSSANGLGSQKRRLLQIALCCTGCLLLNMIVTIETASKLDEWSRSSDIWLTCSIEETWLSRKWENYNFVDGQEVCSASALTAIFEATCQTPCLFSEGDQNIGPGTFCYNDLVPTFCDCSCDDLVRVKRPSVLTMTLSYVAQSMVVAVVGLNMGLRQANLEKWKTFFRNKGSRPGMYRVSAYTWEGYTPSDVNPDDKWAGYIDDSVGASNPEKRVTKVVKK